MRGTNKVGFEINSLLQSIMCISSINLPLSLSLFFLLSLSVYKSCLSMVSITFFVISVAI